MHIMHPSSHFSLILFPCPPLQPIAAVYEMQQKAGFKRLLLEKSIEAVHDSLEKRETALHEVALSTNLPPEVCILLGGWVGVGWHEYSQNGMVDERRIR